VGENDSVDSDCGGITVVGTVTMVADSSDFGRAASHPAVVCDKHGVVVIWSKCGSGMHSDGMAERNNKMAWRTER
jgi:hypothetical protein